MIRLDSWIDNIKQLDDILWCYARPFELIVWCWKSYLCNVAGVAIVKSLLLNLRSLLQVLRKQNLF